MKIIVEGEPKEIAEFILDITRPQVNDVQLKKMEQLINDIEQIQECEETHNQNHKGENYAKEQIPSGERTS